MKKIELGQALSILANLGVVLGLILLVVELKQSNDQTSAAAYQARINEIDVSQQQFALSAELPAIYVKLEESGLGSLDAEELRRVRAWELARLQRMGGHYYQYQQGYLDELAYRRTMVAAQAQINLWEDLGFTVANEAFVQAVRDYKG